MTITAFSKAFEPDPRTKYLYRTNNGTYYGYRTSPNETDIYTITVTSSKVGKVRALLQDKFSIRATSEWSPFSIVGKIDVGLNESTAIFGKSVYNQFLSRRIWNGTSPLAMGVTLKFMAKSDPMNEVLLPTILLMQMALPALPEKEQVTGNGGNDFFNAAKNLINNFLLEPPGPNPLAQNFIADLTQAGVKAINNQFGGNLQLAIPKGDIITIKVGNFTTFSSVIIKDVVIDYPKKMDSSGIPVEATATVEFETFEIQTKEDMISSFNAYIESMKKEDDLEKARYDEFTRAAEAGKYWVTDL